MNAADLSVDEIVARFGVTERTARRWREAKRRLLPPGTHVAVAERNDEIVAFLRERPATSFEVAERFGMSERRARSRLNDLRFEGRVTAREGVDSRRPLWSVPKNSTAGARAGWRGPA